MIEEAYCSYEVSKLLKEKGFDCNCRAYYIESEQNGIERFMIDRAKDYNHSETYLLTIQQEKGFVRPYLRPMSSMTEEEEKELSKRYVYSIYGNRIHAHYHSEGYWDDDTELCSDGWDDLFNWLNSHHFDYRGLIPIGLALKAPEDMYSKQ